MESTSAQMQQQQQQPPPPHGDRRENKVAVHPQRRRSSSLASSKSSSLGGRAEQQDRSTERRPSKFAVLRRQTSSALQGVTRPFTDLFHLSTHHREGIPAKDQSTVAQDGRVVVARDEDSFSHDGTLRNESQSAIEERPSSAMAAEVTTFEDAFEATSPTSQNVKAAAALDGGLLLEESAKFLQLGDTSKLVISLLR
ncbi:hypothetical protein M514_01091 [Trichuris suis]|uniref:Uncharacterized protein n=1 Tax=Trichuris suis TaxID=68888 RepID=A0A085MZC9_9BILA|nr:hypothetical protein M513_01091 [Trichuris suis]KFD62575.1 hypothetical protein M514_01091 [Trichuris suis]